MNSIEFFNLNFSRFNSVVCLDLQLFAIDSYIQEWFYFINDHINKDKRGGAMTVYESRAYDNVMLYRSNKIAGLSYCELSFAL